MKNDSMKSILAASALLFLAAQANAQSRFDYSESDSGTSGPKYEQIVADMQALAQTYPKLATVVTIGQTVSGRPMTLLRIEAPASQVRQLGPRNAVFFSGSTHGDEYLGIEDKLARIFLENLDKLPGLTKYLKSGGVLYVLPIANPDGYTARERENSHGKDLNRDFSVKAAGVKGFTEPEMTNVAKFIDSEIRTKNLKLRVTLDYHCCAGTLLYPWSFKKPLPPTIDPATESAMQSVGKLMQQFFSASYQYGKTPDLLGYSALGTSKDYYFETYGSLSFTFEGVYRQEAQKLDLHVKMWDAILGGLSPAQFKHQQRF